MDVAGFPILFLDTETALPDNHAARGRIPLSIIGGFLGAGKTTLLNHVINNNDGRRFAVVVNDFGAINIDARLIASVEGETIALTNGCVCCVIRDDLIEAVIKLCLAAEPPDHVIIEASGVSKPLQILESFFRPEVAGIVEVQNIITLLDSDQVLGEARTYADIAYAQIAVADIVVINKADLAPRDRLVELRARVEAIVPRARILETRFGIIPVGILFDHDVSAAAAALPPGDGHTHHRHSHEEAHGDHFATWSFRDEDRSYSFDAMQRIVERLPRGIYRAKGIVRLDLDNGDHGVLQVTGRRSWLRLVPTPIDHPGPVMTELVFIGRPGSIDEVSLAALFADGFRAATDPATPHRVDDLRAFKVEFA